MRTGCLEGSGHWWMDAVYLFYDDVEDTDAFEEWAVLAFKSTFDSLLVMYRLRTPESHSIASISGIHVAMTILLRVQMSFVSLKTSD